MAGGRAGQRERLMLPRRRPAHAAVRARPRSSSATLRTRHSRRSSHSLLPRRHPAHEARVGGRKSGVERTTDPSASTQARTFGSMTLRASQRGALMIAVRTAFEDSLSRQRRLRAQHELRAPAGSSSGASACSARRAAKTSQATPAAFCPHSLPQAESERRLLRSFCSRVALRGCCVACVLNASNRERRRDEPATRRAASRACYAAAAAAAVSVHRDVLASYSSC